MADGDDEEQGDPESTESPEQTEQEDVEGDNEPEVTQETATATAATLPRRRGPPPPYGGPVRFHVVPKNGWDKFLRGMNNGARNILTWKGAGDVPSTEQPCWFLPCSDDVAVQIASRQSELRQAGWKVLAPEPHVVVRLSDKARLREFAESVSLAQYLPVHYSVVEPDQASYPSILKSATGEYGKDCHIVRCSEDVRRLTQAAPPRVEWVFQELIRGVKEYSISMIVVNGKIIDSVCIEYIYDREEYVYPHVKQLKKGVHETPSTYLAVLEILLQGYSGICNFNYKVRKSDSHTEGVAAVDGTEVDDNFVGDSGLGSGGLCILEANTRVGGDLAVDVPRQRARELFERLDTLNGCG
eukprot:TRINITY_DN75888_c0_g1_i1.p1 TRINITY_DN75888_c0_g1~~TRINITY_DN75888_c0_g1_i1.p1  ORF type:complete len:384 (-),score=70.70 TRINITY_DN75888_c0_g1_i1:51-1118(-)